LVKVNSSQYNYQYGDQLHLPYSVAMLYSYIKSKKNFYQHFKFEKTFVFRNKVSENVNQCKTSDILLCSCYIWNWEITTHLAKQVKSLNPNCLIIFGGPQVPEDTRGFFEKYPFIDILVHGEGEYILENIFKVYLEDKDWSKVKGISTKSFRTAPQERINNLDEIPSPYLTNLIWDLVDKDINVQWDCSWETNRGCPYLCTFCDWGSATFTKVRKFVEDRLFKEIEWFADNKIVYLDCCDANFGIFEERDLLIARKLKEQALQKNFPKKLGVAWAKNTTEKILPVARELRDGGILGGVTLAVQSLDPTTLKIIKRSNIKFEKFSDLTATFRLNEIPTYTEIILGLPGETLESFKRGLETVAQTKIDTVLIYNCSVLPNAPMNIPEYREKYNIKTIRSPVFLRHSSTKKEGIQEYEDIVVGASSYTLDDLKQMRLYAWAFSTFQNLSIFEHYSNYYHQIHNLEFMSFYETFLEYCRNNESMFSQEYKIVVKYLEDGYSGKGWDHYDQNLGDIVWPIEEASWLRLVPDKRKFVNESRNFLQFLENKFGYNTEEDVLENLIKFQAFLLTTRDDDQEVKSESFQFDWKDFFINNRNILKSIPKQYYFKNLVIEKDPIQWGYQAVFFGRRARRYKCNPEKIHEEKSTLEITPTVK